MPVSRLGLACPPQAQRSVQDLAEDLQQEILQQIQRAQDKVKYGSRLRRTCLHRYAGIPFHCHKNLSFNLQWQHVDNKAAVIVAALGSGFLLWLSLSLLSAIRILPVVSSVVARRSQSCDPFSCIILRHEILYRCPLVWSWLALQWSAGSATLTCSSRTGENDWPCSWRSSRKGFLVESNNKPGVDCPLVGSGYHSTESCSFV